MKLHYNSEERSVATVRKLKAVIVAVDAKVEFTAYASEQEVPKISAFNALPVLESPDGAIFSSSAIVRYLAATHKNDLYGGENAHSKALIDQWLDLTTTEFELPTKYIIDNTLGVKVDFGKLMEAVNKFLAVVEKHLANNKFLVGQSLSIADLSLAACISVVFGVMFGEGQRKKYPNTVTWYTSVAGVHADVGPKDLPKEAHDAFKGGKKGGKKQEKKEEKEEKKADDDDLFGDDDAGAAPAPKPVVKAKPKKEKPAAKSIVVFDVKVYEQQEDLQALFQKIKGIEMDGLVWNNEPKIITIAFGMNKLQVGCVVQDAKISLEDVYEKIEDWEEVQSTDTVSFQKL